MQVSNSSFPNRVNEQTLREQGPWYRPSTSPYFDNSFSTWIEAEQKANLSEQEMNELKSKYNSRNMTDKDNVDLLGDLVKMGAITKQEAANIYIGVIPLSEDDMNTGTLRKCDADFNSKDIRAGNSFDTTDWLEHYQEVMEAILSKTNANMKESNVMSSYQEYIDILGRLAYDKDAI